MAGEPTKVYPLEGRYLIGVPHAVQELPSKREAEELVATGAFTLNANDPERLRDAADLTASSREPDQQPGEGVPKDAERNLGSLDQPAPAAPATEPATPNGEGN
jgi:hypothetical protein